MDAIVIALPNGSMSAATFTLSVEYLRPKRNILKALVANENNRDDVPSTSF